MSATVTKGSSPQVRGRLVAGVVRVCGTGLIPAGAGQTTALQSQVSDELGSSPQVRGRRTDPRLHTRRYRLIPAGAGQTAAMTLDRYSDLGSSPQVRGRLKNTENEPEPIGLIPAGAGQTSGANRTQIEHGAHPRRCGADFFPWWCVFFVWGSSPQVRGRQRGCGARAVAPGLIPAGAGQTT